MLIYKLMTRIVQVMGDMIILLLQGTHITH